MADFKSSQTKLNLMKAFAGESQARNRYTFAAEQAKKQNLQVVEAVFTFTAGQEKEHAELFYHQLRELSGENLKVEGTYPIDISDSVEELLKMAQHNEYEEHDPVYSTFGKQAQEEGFPKAANLFFRIAEIEKTHGDRFGHLADLMGKGELFVSAVSVKWMCLNCGHILEGTEAPAKCPVCEHDRGYFIRLELAPYTS